MTTRILDLTVLPYRLTAKSWIDEQFKSDLLRNPKSFLLDYSQAFKRECNYLIIEDSISKTNYQIPHLSETQLSDIGSNLYSQLENEIGETKDFEHWLPVKVLYSSITDTNYLKKLIENPISFLKGENYVINSDINILQNSSSLYHLPLRKNILLLQNFNDIMISIMGDAKVLSSSGCCASGTCSAKIPS